MPAPEPWMVTPGPMAYGWASVYLPGPTLIVVTSGLVAASWIEPTGTPPAGQSAPMFTQ